MPEQQLLDALERYQEHEEYAQKLFNLITEDEEIELRCANTDLAALTRIESAISERIHDVSDQIERAGNQSMDNFINRRIT